MTENPDYQPTERGYGELTSTHKMYDSSPHHYEYEHCAEGGAAEVRSLEIIHFTSLDCYSLPSLPDTRRCSGFASGWAES